VPWTRTIQTGIGAVEVARVKIRDRATASDVERCVDDALIELWHVGWADRPRRLLRYIIAWKLCTTMKAEDVIATLEMALEAATLENNGSS
jgi:hypothetical protein